MPGKTLNSDIECSVSMKCVPNHPIRFNNTTCKYTWQTPALNWIFGRHSTAWHFGWVFVCAGGGRAFRSIRPSKVLSINTDHQMKKASPVADPNAPSDAAKVPYVYARLNLGIYYMTIACSALCKVSRMCGLITVMKVSTIELPRIRACIALPN